MPEIMTNARLKSVAEAVASLVSLWVTLCAIAGGVWFFVDDEFTTKLAKLSGAAHTSEQLEILTKEVLAQRHDMNERFKLFEDRLNKIATNNSIFEIDQTRSLVWDDCPTEGQCRYIFRVRRTELGQHCGTPEARRFVIDRFGVTHPVGGVNKTNSARTDGEWTELSNAFILPMEIPTGVAEFYMELTYYECFPEDPTRKVRETTPKLMFQINPR